MSRIAQALQRLRDLDPTGEHAGRRLGVIVGPVADVTESVPAMWRGAGAEQHVLAPPRSRGPIASVGPSAVLLAVAMGSIIALLVGRSLLFPDVFTAALPAASLDGTVFTGTIASAAEMTVAAPLAGTVLEVLVRVGDRVATGGALVRLDDSSARAALESAVFEQRAATERLNELQARAASLDRQIAQQRVELANAAAALSAAQFSAQQVPMRQMRDSTERAGALLDQAKRSFARARELFAAGVIARNALEEADVAVRVAEDDYTRAQEAARAAERLDAAQQTLGRRQADLARAESREQRKTLLDQIAQARLELERATTRVDNARQSAEAAIVRAPRDGVVSDLPAGLGDHVAAGAPVGRLTSTEDLMVEVEVAARLVNALRPSQPVTIALPTLPVQRVSGEIYSISPVPSARMTHLVRVKLRNPTGMLLSGQPAQVVFSDDD
jgi:membrane fusion protein (multidrug efflux system)